MKKLVLMTAVAVIGASPVFAADASYSKRSTEVNAPGHSYTIVDRKMEGDTVRITTRETVRGYTHAGAVTNEEGDVDYTGRYDLASDTRHLDVNGTSAYMVTAGGYRYFAPKGAYTTDRGETIFIEDGQVLRMEAPPEVVYLDADDLTGANVTTRTETSTRY
jgi:hypothetical protein